MEKGLKLGDLEPGDRFERSFDLRASGFMGSLRRQLKESQRCGEYTRPFMVGDPIRLIDWKVYGRSDQLIVREAKAEAQGRVLLGLDSRRSMLWPNKEELPQLKSGLCTKWELGLRVLMNLAYNHLLKNDRVSLYFISEEAELWELPGLKCRKDILDFFELLRLEGFGPEKLKPYLSLATPSTQIAFSTLYLCSDGLSELAMLPWSLPPAKAFFLHTLSTLETQGDWLTEDWAYIEGPGQRPEFKGSQLKFQNYFVEQISQWQKSLLASWEQRGYRALGLHDQCLAASFFQSLSIP